MLTLFKEVWVLRKEGRWPLKKWDANITVLQLLYVPFVI